MDFGLAKFMTETIESEAETKSLLTMPGTIMGTMPYMSPAQVHGQPLDARTDIFSFGVLLYEMVTGQLPFAAESAAGIMSAILTRDPAPLSDYISRCPQELQRIVSKCLQKDRERRYQTIRDVETDLEIAREDCVGGISLRGPSDRNSKPNTKVTVSDLPAPRTAFITSRRALVFGGIVLLVVFGLSSHWPAG